MSAVTTNGWLRLGAVRPAELTAARLELHWALQLPAAVGIARAAPAPDYAHHALQWDASHHALVGPPVSGSDRRTYRAGLRLSEGTLLFLSGKGALIESLPLAGQRTLREGLDWLEQASARYTGEAGAPLSLPEHELPAHPLERGARFGSADPAHALELGRWFASLARLLDELRAGLWAGREASPVRVWSHHFDLDTVLALEEGLALERGRTLALGFSPGDESIAEPYLYVLPSPAPEARVLAPLPAPMAWVQDGWVGAVLLGSALAALPAAAQAELAERSYRAGEAALRAAEE
jgi:hypothetical protein